MTARLFGCAIAITAGLALRAVPDTVHWTVWAAGCALILVGSYGLLVAASGRWAP